MGAGVLWQLEVGRCGRYLAASGLSVGAALRLWRGVWGSEGGTNITAAQQIAAPDRPQCRRFCSFVARLKVGRNWRAAGELGVVPSRAAWSRVIIKYADGRSPME